MACTAVADDNGMRALCDVAAVAADIEYRVIGGHMVRLLRHVYSVPGTPRLTSDADTGIDVNVASTGNLHDRLTALGYTAECGNRYELGEQAVDLLVPAAAQTRQADHRRTCLRRSARAAVGARPTADRNCGHSPADRWRHA